MFLLGAGLVSSPGSSPSIFFRHTSEGSISGIVDHACLSLKDGVVSLLSLLMFNGE